MTGAVYIHTRDRLAILERSLPKWVQVSRASTEINLVVEPNEVKMHNRALKDWGLFDRIGVIRIPKSNMGMGNSRHIAFRDAKSEGHKSFITTDDDLFPREGPERLLRLGARKDVFGIGAYLSIYGLLLGMDKGTGTHRTAFGFRCWAMNTEKVDGIGGMPTAFKGYDDHEVCRQGIARYSLPWYVDSDTTIASIGKIGDPGGMSSLPGMSNLFNRKHTAHVLSFDRWPDYVNDPSRCDDKGKCNYRMSWKKFMRDNNVTM
jgi:hypothetical protein